MDNRYKCKICRTSEKTGRFCWDEKKVCTMFSSRRLVENVTRRKHVDGRKVSSLSQSPLSQNGKTNCFCWIFESCLLKRKWNYSSSCYVNCCVTLRLQFPSLLCSTSCGNYVRQEKNPFCPKTIGIQMIFFLTEEEYCHGCVRISLRTTEKWLKSISKDKKYNSLFRLDSANIIWKLVMKFFRHKSWTSLFPTNFPNCLKQTKFQLKS